MPFSISNENVMGNKSFVQVLRLSMIAEVDAAKEKTPKQEDIK